MADHTPTPWKVSSGSTHISPVGAAGGICKFESLHGMYTNHEANAAFIVKACNIHEVLIEVLKNVDPFLSYGDNVEGRLKYLIKDTIASMKETA